MAGETIKIKASEGGEFDCYLAMPPTRGPVPAIVLGVAIHGVDKDIRDLADAFAAEGVIAAAPDLFWRWLPGPLARSDTRARGRADPRAERIKANEADFADTLAMLKTQPQFNGRAAVIGFCYSGPFANIAPKRLGYAAGISCHGSRMQDYIGDLDGVTAPVCILWGDQDHQAPPEVLDAYRAVAERMANVELHVFPGGKHGYMMPDAGADYDKALRDFSFARTLAILNDLRGDGEALRKAS